LPKVSKALAEVFFEAYLGNGNIRQFPYSEPVAVVTAEDRREYLSVRTDRRRIPGRPNETVHLEFAKEFCVACIGEDIPAAFLSGLGIDMVTAGPGGKKRVVVNPLLETQQPNVYLLGDILSPAYFETEDFTADPASFHEIKRRGNIKAALRDGVLVAEAVAQKLAGKADIRIDLAFEEAPAKIETKPRLKTATAVVEREGPRPEAAASREGQPAYLIRILAGNVEADEFPLNGNGLTTIGRSACDLTFMDDMLLSEKHASISHNPAEDGYWLRDDGSVNGVFLRVKEARPLEITPGSLVRIGKQYLLFGKENGTPLFVHFDQTGKQVERYQIPKGTIVLGREAPDLTLDAKDMTLSRRHLAVILKEDKVSIKDLGSANGAFLKVRSAVRLEDGDQFRAGQQLFKLRLKPEAERRTVLFNTKPGLAPPAQMPPKPAGKPAPRLPARREAAVAEIKKPEGLAVVFKNANKTIAFKPGQSICELAEKNGIKIKADCHIGSCGIDPIRILSGLENMNEAGDEEQGTLEDINKLKPGEYRLACMAKPKGPVVVEILEK
jgi:pSer/pThr/pTyr-binding forkhead associated (FHA) protein/ferredoxin